METKWHFNRRHPRATVSDSANDAFFTADKLENLSEALVREGIQNSLDAASDRENRQVRVVIRLIRNPGEHAIKWIRDAFDHSIEHFKKGVREEASAAFPPQNYSYLVFEDFGTTGLTGDIKAHKLSEVTSNAFWSFFRAVGISAKKEDSLGRWGIGKQVFSLSSLARSMFGLTVRPDNPHRVLMGAATLRSRMIENEDYDEYGRYGCATNDDAPIMPVEESPLLDVFAQAFELERKDQPGLSVVVPWVDERINKKDIQAGVVRNFFWPIFQGELDVVIVDDDNSTTIDCEKIKDLASLLDDGTEKELINFASWAAFVKAEKYVTLDMPSKPSWSVAGDMLYTDEKLKTIKDRLENDGRVCVKVPMKIRAKAADAKSGDGHFLLFYQTCRSNPCPTKFLREGIVITDIRGTPTGSSRSLVVVEKGHLASLLGDSEGVNHTQWQKDSPKFHNRYFNGPDTIKFVVRSVGELLKRLNPSGAEKSTDLLLDIFSVPDEESEKNELRKKPESPTENGTITNDAGKGPPLKPRRYKLERRDDGFVILPNTSLGDGVFPYTLRVKAGYAVRRGNGINNWAQDDFRFGHAPLRYEPAKPKGATIRQEDGNALIIDIKSPEFEIGVFGFGRERDLDVRITEVKDETDI